MSAARRSSPRRWRPSINRHPAVRMSLVWPRGSPVMGAIVAADIVLEPGQAGRVRRRARTRCCSSAGHALPAHKVPVSVRQVASLAIAESGKLVRRHA